MKDDRPIQFTHDITDRDKDFEAFGHAEMSIISNMLYVFKGGINANSVIFIHKLIKSLESTIWSLIPIGADINDPKSKERFSEVSEQLDRQFKMIKDLISNIKENAILVNASTDSEH